MNDDTYDTWKLDTPEEVPEVLEIDYSTLEVDGIDTMDYPDFCDAYICRCEYTNGEEISDADLDLLNDDGDLVYNLVQKHLY